MPKMSSVVLSNAFRIAVSTCTSDVFVTDKSLTAAAIFGELDCTEVALLSTSFAVKFELTLLCADAGAAEVGLNEEIAVGTDVGELLIVALEQAKVEVAVLEPHVDVLHPVEPPHP